MKSIIVSACIMMLSSATLQGQTDDWVVKSNNKGLYLDHKVTAKENFYSIGRSFNVHPKHLASFNSLNMSKGLTIGQLIKIPLTDTNFNQNTDNGIPVYYVTSNNEGLYRVSTNNNNVLMEKLATWNNLTSENISPGSRLIVGFLVTSETQTVTAARTQPMETEKKEGPDGTNKEMAKNETAVTPEPQKEPIKKEEQPLRNTEAVQVKEEIKTPKDNYPQGNSKQGYFKTSFEQQISQQPISNEQTVTAGIFKTASGWSDSKYYLLMDGAEAGTIVKITNPTNNKIIYAKLLGEMNGLKQNQGLNVRISNAAASALDISETDKFIVKLNY